MADEEEGVEDDEEEDNVDAAFIKSGSPASPPIEEA